MTERTHRLLAAALLTAFLTALLSPTVQAQATASAQKEPEEEVVKVERTCGLPADAVFRKGDLAVVDYHCNLSTHRLFMRQVADNPGDLIEHCQAIHNGALQTLYFSAFRPNVTGALKISAYKDQRLKFNLNGQDTYLASADDVNLAQMKAGDTAHICWITETK